MDSGNSCCLHQSLVTFVIDSVLNKTLCFSFIPDLSNERNPFDYFNEEDPDARESIKKRTAKLFAITNNHPASYSKFKRFIKK